MAASIEIPDPTKGARTLWTQICLRLSLALGVLLRVHQQFPVSLTFAIFIPQACVHFPVAFSPAAAEQRFSLKENISCHWGCFLVVVF